MNDWEGDGPQGSSRTIADDANAVLGDALPDRGLRPPLPRRGRARLTRKRWPLGGRLNPILHQTQFRPPLLAKKTGASGHVNRFGVSEGFPNMPVIAAKYLPLLVFCRP